MSFDTFAVAAIAAELRTVVRGGRVQQVTQINSLTYALEIFVHPTRHYLILSAEPQAPRLYLTLDKARRGVGNDTPLMLVLRKYMRGAWLKAVEQPPYERLLQLQFEGPLGPVTLVIELIGTRCNLLLLDADGSILGVARLSKPEEVRPGQRVLVPTYLYEPPSPQNKLAPEALTEYRLRQAMNEAAPGTKLARLLTRLVSGVGPLLGREIAYRATGQAGASVADLTQLTPFLTAFEALFSHYWQDSWQPTLAFVDEEEEEIETFAVYPLRHQPHTRPTETVSEAIEIYFSETATGYAAAKAPLEAAIEAARERLARRRERLQEDAAALDDPDLLKQKGEALLAYAYQIEPGQTELRVEWPGHDEPLVIRLDPALSAPENAQQYFNRYRKAQRAGAKIPAQFGKIELEEQYLEQMEQDLAMAEDRPEINAITEALSEAGYYRPKRRKKRQKSGAGRFLRLTAPDGAAVWVGKNARQNAHLTFNRASPDDLWLHARDVPGSHVVIPTAEGLPSEADVFWAAGVAAFYSRARHDTSVDVIVTLKKYVRSIKGASPSLVTFRNESTLHVAPHPPEDEA